MIKEIHLIQSGVRKGSDFCLKALLLLVSAYFLSSSHLQAQGKMILSETNGVAYAFLNQRVYQGNIDSIAVWVRLPPKIKEGKNVRGVMVFSHWGKNNEWLEHMITKPYGEENVWEIRLADNTGYAVVAPVIPGTQYNLDKNYTALAKHEYREYDRNFKRIATAWERAVTRCVKEFGLPEDGWFMSGTSGGAQIGHRLALRYPERFAAVHLHVCSTYEKPRKEAGNILWLITTGERDYGMNHSVKFYQDAQAIGWNVMIKIISTHGHGGLDEKSLKAVETFFQFAEKAREESEQRKNFTHHVRSLLSDAPYYGDFVNNVVFTAGHAHNIPEGNRVPLPSTMMAQAWGEIIR